MRYAAAFADDGKTPLAGDDLFSSRGEHLLYFEEADRAPDWKKALPELAWASDGDLGTSRRCTSRAWAGSSPATPRGNSPLRQGTRWSTTGISATEVLFPGLWHAALAHGRPARPSRAGRAGLAGQLVLPHQPARKLGQAGLAR